MSQLVNLKQFRQKMKLTQAAAAEGIGIDQRQWNQYENGWFIPSGRNPPETWY